jgi:hypothetical protein
LASAAGAAAPPAAPVLSVTRPTLHHRQEDGPAIADGYEYLSGQLLHYSFRISGFKVQKDKVDLRWLVVAVDPEGRLLVPAANGAIREEVGINDKDWLPKVQQTIPLPAQLGPGVYQLKLTVADEFAGASAEKEIEFRVGGRALPRAEKLTILNLRFLKAEADRQAMEPAVYRVGETLLAKFELAGFQLGEKNRFDVDYGLSILSPSGKVLYTQPKAAADSGAPFYPQRMLMGALTLNLTEGVQAAEYTLVVQARDLVGNLETEARSTFRVER